MNRNYDEAIARYICLAQAASDAGKEYKNTICEECGWSKALYEQGYYNKLFFIERAIDLINRSKKSNFAYYCEGKEDQNGYWSIVTYFSYKLYGKRKQISFHTPADKAGWLVELTNKNTKMHWAKNQSSRDNAIELWRYYF